MKTAATMAQMLVRITGLIQIVLGLLFWSGHALSLLPVHMLVGTVLVLSLWVLAILGARAGVGWGRAGLAILWGFIVPALGMVQGALLSGQFHWVVQVVHLLVGMAAMSQAEALATRIKQTLPAARTA